MPRNYTPVPDEYMEEMAKLTNEQFGRLIRACMTYSITGEFPPLNDPEDFYRARCKNRLDRYYKEFASCHEKHVNAGLLGAQRRWHPLSVCPEDDMDDMDDFMVD